MGHVLHAQLTSIIPINGDSRRHNFNQVEPHHAPAKRGRTRGVVLSKQGWQRLMQAGALYAESGERRTYEQLSERSQLDERTVKRLLSCKVKVDKNTLKTFFRAFNLWLEAGDYTTCRSERTNDTTSVSSTHAMVAIEKAEFEQIVEELTQLKQRLREYDHLFHQLSLNEGNISWQVGA